MLCLFCDFQVNVEAGDHLFWICIHEWKLNIHRYLKQIQKLICLVYNKWFNQGGEQNAFTILVGKPSNTLFNTW